MKIGIQSMGTVGCDPGENLKQEFQKIKDAGFEAVDFNFEVFVDSRTQYRSDGSCFFDKPIDELVTFFAPYKKACIASGLEFSQGHAMFGEYPETENELSQFIKVQKNVLMIAGDMGIPYLVIHPLNLRRKQGKEAEIKKNLEYFTELAPAAKEAGVVICLENLFTWENGRVFTGACTDENETVFYMKELNSKFQGQFGFCLDTGHANLMRKNLREYINIIGDYIKILHIHENDGVRDLHAMPFTYVSNWGSPSLSDWDGVIDGLADIGYDGTLNCETGPVFFALPERLHDPARKFMYETGAYLRDEIKNRTS